MQAQAQTLTPWRHGTVQAKGDAGFLFMAADGGFAKKQGLDMQMVTLKNDTLLLKSLLAGELDSYEGAPGSPFIAASKGGDVRIVGCHWQKLTYIMYSSPKIASVKDLKGKTIGVSAPGSQPDLFARAVLRAVGLSQSDVKFVTAGSDSERILSLAAGVIDAAPASSEFSAKATEIGAKPLARAIDLVPESMRRCLYVTGKKLAEQPQQVAHFLAAELNAYQYSLGHRDETMALSRKIAKLPASNTEPALVFDEVVKENVVSKDFMVDPAKLVWQRDLLASTGSIDPSFDPNKMLDTTALKAALKLNGN
jgi:NitT/TauT family transport system substrate-binding protein